jgi:predicted  nucleic acid-binding Zn-ribbon protein
MVGSVLTACKPSTKEEINAQENLDDAKEEVKDAREDLVEAKRAATAEEWQAFKDETNVAITANETRIDELKVKIKKTGNSIDDLYEKEIDALEKKNEELKVRMNTYKNDTDADWESFKREFKYDMNELGKSLKDLTVNNKN